MSDVEGRLRGSRPTGGPSDAVLEAWRRRAAAEGLLDVAYASVESPLGPLVVAATPQGLVRVSYSEFRGEDEVLEELARRVSPRVLEAPARLDRVRRELDEYFEGRRRHFDVSIDLFCAIRNSHARRLSALRSLGYARSAAIQVS